AALSRRRPIGRPPGLTRAGGLTRLGPLSSLPGQAHWAAGLILGIGQEQRLYAAAGLLAFDTRIAGLEGDPQLVALHHLRALGDHHVAVERDLVGGGVIDAVVTSRDLILLRDLDVAFGFDALDLLVAGAAGLRGRPGGVGTTLLVIDDQGLAIH